MKIPPRFLAAAVALFGPALCAVAAPSITTLSPAAGNTVSALSSISVTFSETVAGVDAGDLLIDGEAASSVSGTGAGPYIFTFTQPAAGTVSVSWDFDHGITGVGTGAFVPAGGWSYTLTDTVAPTVAKIRSSVAGQELDAIVPLPGSTVGTLSKVQISFSEPVTGVDAADLLMNGTPATAVTGSGAGPYVFDFAAPAPGTVNFSWASGHGIQDVSPATNAFVGNPWSVTLNSTGSGNLVINEFLAANATSIVDENQDQSGWIEIYNPGPNAVNLTGWSLTNDENDLGLWVFSGRTIAANTYLVVFASAKDRKPASGNLHTNFKLNPTGEYLALVPPDFPRVPVSQLNPYPTQRYDYSYGLQSGGVYRYIARPTTTTDTRPGTVNLTSTLSGITPKPTVSVSRGFFKDPFQLAISCADPNATIRYTLDGSAPLVSSPVYTEPLNITGTTLLRVTAFGTNAIPSETVTHSYIFPDQVFTQPSPPYDNPTVPTDNTNPQLPKAGNTTFPISWGTRTTGGFPGRITNLTTNTIPADYGMDPVIYNDARKYDDNGVVNNVTGKTNKERIQQGFRELPILSVVMNMNDMFGPTGIYPNSTVKNPPVERACSVELLLPDGSKGFATTCGIRPHGNASRNPENCPKHGFTLKFKGDFGADDLDYQLFPDSPVHKLDDLVLRADYNSSWLHGDGGTQRPKGTRQRDAWTKDTFRAMGGAAGHHRYVNLFINGLYWGTYDATEQENDTFAANYFGGKKSDYEVVEQGSTKSATNVAGNVYASMTALASSGALASNSNYEVMKRYLDVPEFVDYMLLHFYVGHQDWGDDINKNWYAIRNRVKNGTFKYLPWDQENLLWDPNVDRTTVLNPPSGLHTKLVANAQYKLDFADRVHRHMVAPDGALLPQASIARWNKWRALLLNSMVAESARWGDYRLNVHQYSSAPYVLYTWNIHLMAEHTRLTGTYFPQRTNVVLGQLRTQGLYPTLNAPELRDNGTDQKLASQRVSAGFQLKMALPATPPSGTTNTGTIYYTTDGTDPRVYYAGTVAATAQTYTAPITLNSNTTIKARTFNAGTWSALNEATFTVSAPLIPSVRITEIMYNPLGGTNYEFLELQNTGTREVNMGGWYFEGIDFMFPVTTVLAPGSRLVLASNNDPIAWASRYPGVTPLGYFGGSLDNSGERIALHDTSGRIVVSVEYGNKAPWPQNANGGGYSLELIDPNADPDLPANWKTSDVTNGTPGLSNGSRPVSPIELSEVMVLNNAVSNAGVFSPYIELRNNSASAVDVGNWKLTAVGSFTIPSGTSIAANGLLVIWLDNAVGGSGLHADTLNLNAKSGAVELFDPLNSTAVDAVGYGWQVQGYSIGRVAGAGSEWVLTQASPGTANAAAALAPASNLALNEWLANQGTTDLYDWVELYNKHASLPVAIQGLYLQTTNGLARIPYLGFVAPGGFVQLPLSEQFGAVDLKLPAAGTSLALLDVNGEVRDSVTVSPLAPGVSEGRYPDGSANIFSFGYNATPGAANFLVQNYTGPLLNELLVRNQAAEAAPWGDRVPWVELFNPGAAEFDLSGYGLHSSRVPDAALTFRFPNGTKIPAQGYLTVWLGAPAQGVAVPNGTLFAGGLIVSGTRGAIYLFDSGDHVVDAIEWGHQIADASIGRSGASWKLLASRSPNAANSAPATLGSVTNVKLNEWLAAPAAGDVDFVELYNTDANPVDLSGLYLTDDPSTAGLSNTQIVPLSFIAPGGWARFLATGSAQPFEATTNFSLDAQGENLRLSASDLSLIDAVSYGSQAPGASGGRVLDGQGIATGLTPTPGTRNVLPPAPTITANPVDRGALPGGSVSFSATATGSNPLSYQWLFNDAPISGATAQTLTVSNVSAGNEGRYACVVTNSAGSATSTSAKFVLQRTFAEWQTQFFNAAEQADTAISGVNADPDGDGISNLLEFFHGLNPRIAATAADRNALPQIGVEPATGTPLFLTLTFRQGLRAGASATELQVSPTLGSGTWNAVTPDVIEQLGIDAVTGDPRVRWKVSIAPGEAKKFLRLQITP